MVTILASIAQQESASISQNVRMGINFGFQEGRGRVNFSSFLGYRRGDRPGIYEIVPAEADVVRRIFVEVGRDLCYTIYGSLCLLGGVKNPGRRADISMKSIGSWRRRCRYGHIKYFGERQAVFTESCVHVC